MKTVFDSQFPDVPPKCYFLTKIFHPTVAKNGEVCVNTLKKDWTKDLGILHILLVGLAAHPYFGLTFLAIDGQVPSHRAKS